MSENNNSNISRRTSSGSGTKSSRSGSVGNGKGQASNPNEKSHILKNNSGTTATAAMSEGDKRDSPATTSNEDAAAALTKAIAISDTNERKKVKKQFISTTPKKSGGTSKGNSSKSTTRETELSPLPPVPVPPPSSGKQSTRVQNDLSQLVEQPMDLEGNSMNLPPKSTMAHASFNYINSILGSGVIGMPYALHQAGVGLGLLLMIFVAYITDYSLVLMVRSGQLSGSYTYPGMMESVFGRWGYYILSILQLVYPLIAMISYNIIVGDTLTKVLVYFSSDPHEVMVQREVVVLAATIFVTLPLSLYRNVARMSKVSFFSLVAIGFIMIAILIRLDTSELSPTVDSWQFANTGVVQAIGVFSFAFMCHHNSFMIYSSIENANESKWRKVTHVSVGTALFVCLIFSLGGYATFTGHIQGDLLENYCWDDDLINISRFLFCFTILLTFPLECFVVRDVIENFWFKEKQPSTTSRHFSITLSIVVLAYVISISTDCLGIVLELNGVLAAIPLAYILPALCYIRLEPSRVFSRVKLPAVGIAIFGIVVSTTGLLLLIFNGQSSNCSHGKPMSYCTPFNQLNFTTNSILGINNNYSSSVKL